MDIIARALAIQAKNIVKPVNILRYNADGSLKSNPIIPTAGLWDVAPTNLVNLTDGNTENPAGYGSKAVSAGGTLGYIFLDLGAIKTVNVSARLSGYSASGTIYVFVDGSDDNFSVIARPSAVQIAQITQPVEANQVPVDTNMGKVTARYVRLRFTLSTANTGYVKPYEIFVNEVGGV